jgi:DNA processing protein
MDGPAADRRRAFEEHPVEIDLLALSLLPDLPPRVVHELAAGVPVDEVSAVLPSDRGAALRRAEDVLRQAERSGTRLVGWDDEDYPPMLRRIYDPPPVLYVRGALRAGEGPCAIAIVGARRCSPAGAEWARSVARDLTAAGMTVVSGLARGIDAAAHRGALDGGGRTVAVLGSGLDQLYPPENVPLAERIAERGGAVVTEFAFGLPPFPQHFPRRNRIIAGWTRGVVVVEAAEKSGALSTARQALEEGREVLAVPGHPGHTGSVGTNQLIRDGAVLVRDAGDVAQEMRWTLPPPRPAEADDPLLRVLAREPRGLDELQSRSGWAVPKILSRLTELELADKVRRLPGPLFVRS